MPALTRAPVRAALPLTPLLRAFSTTTTRTVAIPPESPKFLEVPSYGVPRQPANLRQKGVLPSPKKLFLPSDLRKGKHEEQYAERTSPFPTRRRSDTSRMPVEAAARVEWNRDMAQYRRENLREGIKEIYNEKQVADAKRKQQRVATWDAQKAAIEKAEREDVRLTLPSVLSVLRMEGKGLPDPNREQRLAEMRKRAEEKEAVKKEERLELIQELYFAAGDFIITEQQLDQAIETAFGEGSLLDAKRPKMLTSQEMLMEKVGGGDRAFQAFGSMVKEVDQKVYGALVGKTAAKKAQEFL